MLKWISDIWLYGFALNFSEFYFHLLQNMFHKSRLKSFISVPHFLEQHKARNIFSSSKNTNPSIKEAFFTHTPDFSNANKWNLIFSYYMCSSVYRAGEEQRSCSMGRRLLSKYNAFPLRFATSSEEEIVKF